jgi:hypothetical protein
MNPFQTLFPTLAVSGLLFAPGTTATPLCENACEMVVEFTVGGRIEAVQALTFTFGEGGLIDLGDGSIMAFGSGGVYEMAGGEALVFAAGGRLDLGSAGNIEHSDATFVINGDLTLRDSGNGMVTLLGSWTIGENGTLFLDSPSTVGANLDLSGAGSVTLGSGLFTPQVPATPILIDPGTLNPGVISGGAVIGSGAVTIGNAGSIDFGSGPVVVVQPETPIDPNLGGTITLNPTIDLQTGIESSNGISVDAQVILLFDGQRVLINHGATLDLASFEPIKTSDFVTLQGMQIPVSDDLSCTVTDDSCIDAQGREYLPVEGRLVIAGQDSALAGVTQQESPIEEGSIGALDGLALAPFFLIGWRQRRIFSARS